MYKIILLSLIVGSSMFAIADSKEILISDNYRDYPYCKILKKVTISKKTKEDAYFELIKQAKELNANVVINTTHAVVFGKNYVSGKIAQCDIEKSPSLTLKNTDTNYHFSKEDIPNKVASKNNINSEDTLIKSKTHNKESISNNQYNNYSLLFGIDLGKSKLTATLRNNHGDSRTSTGDKRSSYSIKIGKVYDEHRVYGKYTNINVEDGVFYAITAHYDQFLNSYRSINPYIGGAFGYVNIKSDDSKLKLSGLAFGPTFGVIVDFTKEVSFEISYDYMLTTASQTFDNSYEIDLDKYNNLKAGINIKF